MYWRLVLALVSRALKPPPNISNPLRYKQPQVSATQSPPIPEGGPDQFWGGGCPRPPKKVKCFLAAIPAQNFCIFDTDFCPKLASPADFGRPNVFFSGPALRAGPKIGPPDHPLFSLDGWVSRPTPPPPDWTGPTCPYMTQKLVHMQFNSFTLWSCWPMPLGHRLSSFCTKEVFQKCARS